MNTTDDSRHPVTVRTAGIDLATQPGRTGVCSIDWTEHGATVSLLPDGGDDALIEVCESSDMTGIDCPFGWPEPFVRAVRAHAEGAPWPGRDEPVEEYRSSLARRATDREVQARTRLTPLSVSADRIGLTTMRCALLLDRLGNVDRTGVTGTVAEVYPAASLHAWGLPAGGYKRTAGRPRLSMMIEELCRRVPSLRFAPGARERCVESDDAFDALVCALTARAVLDGRTVRAAPDQRVLAATEGWIHVPATSEISPFGDGDAGM